MSNAIGQTTKDDMPCPQCGGLNSYRVYRGILKRLMGQSGEPDYTYLLCPDCNLRWDDEVKA